MSFGSVNLQVTEPAKGHHPKRTYMNKVPFSLHNEKQIILTFISNPNLLADFVDSVTPDDFYDPRAQKIYQVMTLLFRENKIIDEEALSEELVKTEGATFDYEFMIGYEYGDSLRINEMVDRLKQLSKKRQLITKVTQLLHILYQEKPHQEMLEQVDKSLFNISVTEKKSKHISEHVIDSFDILSQRIDGMGLIKTGFTELDRAVTGFFPGQLIVIGARTSIGKTSFAVSLAHNVMSLGKKVLFLSLEMPAHEIVIKSVAIEAQVDFRDIINGEHRHNQEIHTAIAQAAETISKWPYYIEDSIYSLEEIKTYCRKIKKEQDIQLIIIDYLGLIHTERYKDSKVLEIGYITRALKLLSKEISVPIVLLAQLNREVESRSDNIPKLSDFRDSGSIEQDADIALLLYREHYYNNQADIHDALLIIAKQRLGPTERLEIHYEPGIMQFRDK